LVTTVHVGFRRKTSFPALNIGRDVRVFFSEAVGQVGTNAFVMEMVAKQSLLCLNADSHWTVSLGTLFGKADGGYCSPSPGRSICVSPSHINVDLLICVRILVYAPHVTYDCSTLFTSYVS